MQPSPHLLAATLPASANDPLSANVRWAAKLHDVQEVSLRGTADGSYWQERLGRAGFTPACQNGRAKVMIVAAAGRFWGIPFRELSVSIALASPAGPLYEPWFLLGAVNSNRFFAFCERALFSTPFQHGNVLIEPRVPAAIRAVRQARTTFSAAMRTEGGSPPRPPAEESEESRQILVFLPQPPTTAGREPRLFLARIAGVTQTYPFRAGEDTLELAPLGPDDVGFALRESQFRPQEWILRPRASHAKSKTYTQSAFARRTGTALSLGLRLIQILGLAALAAGR